MKRIPLITLLCLFAASVSVPFASAVPTKYEAPVPEKLVREYLANGKKQLKVNKPKVKQAKVKLEKLAKKKPKVKQAKVKLEKLAKKKPKVKQAKVKLEKLAKKKPQLEILAKKKPELEKQQLQRVASQQIADSHGGSSSRTSVPDSGSSLILLGIGALGIYAARRFRSGK